MISKREKPDMIDNFVAALKSGTLGADFEKWDQKRRDAEAAQEAADKRVAEASEREAFLNALAEQLTQKSVEDEALIQSHRTELAGDIAAERKKLQEREDALNGRQASLDEREARLTDRMNDLAAKEDAVAAREHEARVSEDTVLEIGRQLSDRESVIKTGEEALKARIAKFEIVFQQKYEEAQSI